ncbi:hypothetical protein [Neobacillus drentensis]|uniref:hypothetical protein n=1 Tax=Neobacillus drentensis TaxID=220684 RepID=UPI00286B6390|nr:hypothetical protein [Neobacillus drentensis]
MNQSSNSEFDGHCAFAESLGKKDVMCNGKNSVVQQGKTYQFSNPVAKLLWLVLPGRKQKAESTWSTI